jgi:hypothetical protein
MIGMTITQRWTATDEYDHRCSFGCVPRAGSLTAITADLRLCGVKHYKAEDSNHYLMVRTGPAGYVAMPLVEARTFADAAYEAYFGVAPARSVEGK